MEKMSPAMFVALSASDKENYICELIDKGEKPANIARNYNISKSFVSQMKGAKAFRDRFGGFFAASGIPLDTYSAYLLYGLNNENDVKNVINNVLRNPKKKQAVYQKINRIVPLLGQELKPTMFAQFCADLRRKLHKSIEDVADSMNMLAVDVFLTEYEKLPMTLDFLKKCLEVYKSALDNESKLHFVRFAVEAMGKVELNLSRIKSVRKEYCSKLLAALVLDEPVPSLMLTDRIEWHVVGNALHQMSKSPDEVARHVSSITGPYPYDKISPKETGKFSMPDILT